MVIRLFITLLLLAFPVTFFGGEQQITDNGQAGTPVPGPDHTQRADVGSFSNASIGDALSSFRPDQQQAFINATASTLGVDISGLSGGSGQTNTQYHWHDPNSQPDEPNTNHQRTSFTTDDGLTVTIGWGSTGQNGTLGSTDNGGGVGQCWVRITDAEGNTSWMVMHVSGGEIQYQEFHLEQLVRDNGLVVIEGPDNIDEDTTSTWTARLDDSSLPPDSDTAWGAKWIGAPSCEWTASGGERSSGSDTSFSSRFLTPGSFEVSVEVTGEYSFRTHRPRPTGAPPPNAFDMVEVEMKGTIRGSGSKSGSVADITPPNMTFELLVDGGSTGRVTVEEEPKDQEPAKNCSVKVEGSVWDETLNNNLSLTTSSSAGSEITIDSTLSPQIKGFHIHEDNRFFIKAKVSDNYSPEAALSPYWLICEDGDFVLPKGTVERFLFRKANVPDGPFTVIIASVADEAGNETTITVPVKVLSRKIGVDNLAIETRKKR